MKKLLSLKKPRKIQSESRSINVPASDQKQNNGELFHFSHPEHNLIPINVPYVFTCMVCKENGAGKRFICQTCGFDMHEFCALAPRSLHNHPFHLEHQLDFSVKTGESRRTKCDICGKTARGYSFRCNTCEFEMHPCCATMSPQMNFPTHQHLLYLSNLNDESSFVCQICMRKRPGQVYHCNACRYYLHAVCAKNFVNGLYIQGVVPPEKRDSIGKLARVAFNLVLKAIGGLIEGIGEGIGDSLVGGIGKGIRCRSIKNKKSSDI